MTTSNETRETELLGPKTIDSELVLGFELHNIADLLVTQVIDATGIQTQSILGTDYSLSIATGNQVTLTLNQALATGERLRIRRISGPRSELSLETSTTLPLPATEDTFDRLAHYHADVLGELDRCVKLSDGEVTPADQGKMDTPDIRKGNYLKYDAITGALTHDPVVVGSAGPQGIAGPTSGIQSIEGDTGGVTTGNAVKIAGTGAISTSHAGDVITIASAAGGVSGLIASGGTTTGSTITLTGTGTTATTRSGDTITISSTGITGERVLLSTLTPSAATEARFISANWPASYRKIEIEVVGLVPASLARLRFKLWETAGSTAFNTNCAFTSRSQTSNGPGGIGNPGDFEFDAHDPGSSAFGNVFETNESIPVDHTDSGITGSIIFTHIAGTRLIGFGDFVYMEGRDSSFCGVNCSTGLTTPIASLDGFQVEMRDHSDTTIDTASVVTFTGIVKIWGHLN